MCADIHTHMFSHSSQEFLTNQHWKVTHGLNEYSTIFISCAHLPKQWRVAHNLDVCSVILISGSNLHKQQRITHTLDA